MRNTAHIGAHHGVRTARTTPQYTQHAPVWTRHARRGITHTKPLGTGRSFNLGDSRKPNFGGRGRIRRFWEFGGISPVVRNRGRHGGLGGSGHASPVGGPGRPGRARRWTGTPTEGGA